MSVFLTTLSSFLVEELETGPQIAQGRLTLEDSEYEVLVQSYLEVLGATTVVVPLGSIDTVRGMFMKSDLPIRLLINGSITPVEIESLIVTGAAITSISVNNVGSLAANVQFVLVGDQT